MTTRPRRTPVSRAGRVRLGTLILASAGASWNEASYPDREPIPNNKAQTKPTRKIAPPVITRRRLLTGTWTTVWTTTSAVAAAGGGADVGGLTRSIPSRVAGLPRRVRPEDGRSTGSGRALR